MIDNNQDKSFTEISQTVVMQMEVSQSEISQTEVMQTELSQYETLQSQECTVASTSRLMARFSKIIARLRDPETGCRWDKAQTLESVKPCCVEEAAEVLAGIDMYNATGNADNLKEELGDLLMQVVLQSQIAEELGLFSLDDVIQVISEKMVRRHPHVFHVNDPANGELEDLILANQAKDENGNLLTTWAEIKALEKKDKVSADAYLPKAFDQVDEIVEAARIRKHITKKEMSAKLT